MHAQFETFRQTILFYRMRDHRDIIAAFEARSPEWASAVMSSHIHAAFQALARSHRQAATDAGPT